MRELRISEIQGVQFNILKKVIEICNEIQINYVLWHGSLLGAVRHHDFVPWDDDMDIAMTNYDYKKFVEYCISNKEKIYPFELHNQETKDNLFYNISRITDERYKLDYYGMSKCEEGIFIDIYRIDPMGTKKDIKYWEKIAKKEKRFRKRMYMIAHDGITFHRWYNTPMMIIAKILGMKHYVKKLNKIREYDWEQSDNAGYPYWGDPMLKKGGVPKEYFLDTVEIPFRNISVKVPKKYKEYLVLNYGNNYMQLPPKEERVGHHGYRAYKKIIQK